MDSPFFDVAYRVVAIMVSFACGRQVWRGFIERRISPWRNLLDFYKLVFHRDTEPVRYWIEMGTQTIGMVICFIAAIIGWWQPNT